MTQLPAVYDGNPFDQIRHEDEQGEYWLARELQKALGYAASWQNFERVIEDAKVACLSQGLNVNRLFNDVIKKSTGGRPGNDYRLARFACYIVALSANSTKDEVAAAKVYFAVKAREQELTDVQSAAIEEMIAKARKRVDTRERLGEAYDELEETAAERGMSGPRNFARLHNEGDLGEYGMSKEALAQRHGIKPQRGQKKVNLNDHMGNMEMAAIILRDGIASADISQLPAPTNTDMFKEAYDAGREVRDMLTSHGIIPEDFPKEPHIDIARRIAEGQLPILPLGDEDEQDG